LNSVDFDELELIGRDGELDSLKRSLEQAGEGKGSFQLLSGEPGIGKTRLLDEFLEHARSQGLNILCGTAAADRLHPFLIFSRALEGVVDRPLFQEEVETSFSQVLAVDTNGLLIAKASSMKEEMDADIFAAMFSAVQSFVADSFEQAGEARSGLGRLEYGNLSILIEYGRNMFLTAVFEGREHEQMKTTLKGTLRQIEDEHHKMLETWGGDVDKAAPVQLMLEELAAKSFTVKRDPESVDIENERTRIANTVLEELRSLTKKGPLLLVLEDLHWADESSLFVLGYLARNLAPERILVVGTSRPGESVPFENALETMDDEAVVEIIELKALGPGSVNDIIEAVYSPNDFPAEFKDGLVERCQGNPFFVLEILRQMQYDDNIGVMDGVHHLLTRDYALPDSLEGVVYRRLDALEPDAMALSEFASCIGREFECQAILSLDSIPDPDGAFESAQEHKLLIRNNGSGEFLHAIYQTVIYQDLGDRWKTTYHRSLGRYYENVCGDDTDSVIYELARHYSRSNEKAKGYGYSRRAGIKAEGTYGDLENWMRPSNSMMNWKTIIKTRRTTSSVS